jgi:hypothetical protein
LAVSTLAANSPPTFEIPKKVPQIAAGRQPTQNIIKSWKPDRTGRGCGLQSDELQCRVNINLDTERRWPWSKKQK